jgi:hypothetical protein
VREQVPEAQAWQARAWVWAGALLRAAIETGRLPSRRLVHLSAGFVALPMDAERPDVGRQLRNQAFGLYALQEDAERHARIETIELGDERFALVVLRGGVELHGVPPAPPGGTGACWVRPRSSKPPPAPSLHWTDGLLTCRHVVAGHAHGAVLPLLPSASHARPASGLLAERDACTIDAAILAFPPADWPAGVTPLAVTAPALPGRKVTRVDRAGSTHGGTVLRVFHDASYAGNLFGQRVIADTHGVPGDSGSLLRDGQAAARGVGLYMGTVPDGRGGFEGMYQDLSQVTRYFNIDLFV